MNLPGPFRRRQPIPHGLWDQLRAAIARLTIHVVWPLEYDPATNTLAYVGQDWLYAKITGAPSGASYPWREQIPTPSGGWRNGTRTGTTTRDKALEVNGYAGVASGMIVVIRRTRDPFWRFEGGSCP
jgi:hypothetical protein